MWPRCFPYDVWCPRWYGTHVSGLGAPDKSHTCLFMVDSDRWARGQTLQWRETVPGSQRVPWKGGEVNSLQRARGRTQRGIMST